MWWYKKFVEYFYKEEWITEEFISMIKSNINSKVNLILTAWDKEFQRLKVEKVWLSFMDTMIVKKSYLKPLAMFKYILYDLECIPEKIEIYDDRVEYFNQNAQLLADLLWTEIHVCKVELDWKNINKTETRVYNPDYANCECLNIELLYNNTKTKWKTNYQ